MDFSDYTARELRDHFKRELKENEICAQIGQELEKHYPGWRWWVDVRLDTGTFEVRNLDLHGDYGFAMLLSDYLAVPDKEKLVMQMGGETLERYMQDRGIKPEVVDVQRDIRGNAIGDVS